MNDLADLRWRAGLMELNARLNYDALIQEFLKSKTIVQHIINLAYRNAQTQDIPLGQRRSLERVGMRATDLLNELGSFINSRS